MKLCLLCLSSHGCPFGHFVKRSIKDVRASILIGAKEQQHLHYTLNKRLKIAPSKTLANARFGDIDAV